MLCFRVIFWIFLNCKSIRFTLTSTHPEPFEKYYLYSSYHYRRRGFLGQNWKYNAQVLHQDYLLNSLRRKRSHKRCAICSGCPSISASISLHNLVERLMFWLRLPLYDWMTVSQEFFSRLCKFQWNFIILLRLIEYMHIIYLSRALG